MKNIILFLLYGFFVSPLSAQCRFEVNDIDPFTKERRLRTDIFLIAQKLYPSESIVFTIDVAGNQLLLDVEFTSSNLNEQSSIQRDNKLLLKLIDGSIIELEPNKDFNAFLPADEKQLANSVKITSGVEGTPRHRLSPKYNIDLKDLNLMAALEIEMIRIKLSDSSYFDYNTKGGVAKKFSAIAKCVFEIIE